MTQVERAPEILADHEAAVLRAVSVMRDGLLDELQLDDLASASHYSRFHFHRTFQRVTFTTPGRFLASLRMQQGKRLLADTDLRVEAVARLVGYESIGTFTTQFGRLVGMSPGRFRQLVDRCGASLRLDEVDLGQSRGGRRLECGRSGGEDDLGDRVTIVGLFSGSLPSGTPAAYSMLHGTAEGRITIGDGDPRSALGISIPAHTRVVDLALGDTKDVLVGRAPVLAEDFGTLRMEFGPVRPVDPPVLSAAPARHLVQRV